MFKVAPSQDDGQHNGISAQTMTEPNTASSTSPLVHDRKNPFLAEITEHRSLTLPGSGKDTRHFVLSLEGSGLEYTPGDSLAVFARNPPELVEPVLQCLAMDGEMKVKDPKGGVGRFREVLQQRYILNRASRKILTGLAERLPEGADRERLVVMGADPAAAAEYLFTRDYLDLLEAFPAARFETPEAFLAQLSPVPPRLYSIASSLAAHSGEVHLCVGIVRYETHGRQRKGLCSGYLADHAPMHRKEVPVYVQESKSFRLPADGDRDIIMVGPGTGIAPFRAFIEQRVKDGARGRNWLIFGEQHKATDYLYGDELEAYRKQGVLHRLDLAFSRDQDRKIYVQHRMKEEASTLWRWLQEGAYFYVCGDARRMAKDVQHTLIEIAAEEGGLSEEEAREHVEVTLMKTEKRYLRDVY